MESTAATMISLLGPPVAFRGLVKYTGVIADRGFRLNQMISSWTQAQNRTDFLADPDGYMQKYSLSETEKQLIKAKDCMGMFRYGVNIYAVAKAGTVLGIALPEIGAAMKASATKES